MKELSTAIEVDASPERVWEILTDFARFPEWNPFIRSASGQLKEGERLEVRLQPSGGRAATFKPVVLRVDPPHELRWLGKLWIGGLFDGEHAFRIEGLGNGARLEQSESFNGILVGLLGGMIDNDTRRGFNEMNAALKARAEAK